MKIEKLKKNNTWKWIGVTLVISVLCIVVTFKGTKAKYRYTASFPAVKGTVHYKSGDLEVLAVNIEQDDGNYVSSDTIPTSGYALNETESYCGLSNGNGEYTHESTNISYENGKVTVGEISKKGTKCFLYFDKLSAASDIILAKYESGSVELVGDGTTDNNIRYIGANPNNYVYFNCSDYSNPSSSTCELWRIIGVMNNVTTGSGTKETLLKIRRSDSIGTYAWNSANTNDWTTASLMTMLNSSDYYNGTLSSGLKNDATRNNMIESVVWNLGGYYSATGAVNGVLTSQFYGYERGTMVYSGRPTTWTGKIGLMYPSDYGSATAGGSTTSRTTCLSTALSSWGGSGVSDCKNNDWLFDSSNMQWTLFPSVTTNGAYAVYVSGYIPTSYHVGTSGGVRPVLYLKSSVGISSGNGTSSSPYILSV